MSIQYIINNSDGLLTGQTITGNITVNGDLSVTGVTNILPYKVYTALLNQTGATEPTAIVLDNTLGGNVIWTRDGVGIYTATLIGAFPDENKFFTLNAATGIYSTNSQILVYWNDINSFQLNTFAGNGVSIPYSPTDDLIFNYPLEIKVYY